MRFDKDWFERMLCLRKRSQDVGLEEKQRASATKAFLASLKRIKLQDVLKKGKEELQYVPLGWLLETTSNMSWEHGEITTRYRELSLPMIVEVYTR